MRLKKLFGCVVCLASLVIGSGYSSTYAADAAIASSKLVEAAAPYVAAAVPYVIKGLEGLCGKICDWFRSDPSDAEKEEYKECGGYRAHDEIIAKLNAVVRGTSPIAVYGQMKAKDECYKRLLTFLADLRSCGKAQNGSNVVYITGPAGTGKTMLARAIAYAFMKYEGDIDGKKGPILCIGPDRISAAFGGETGALGTRLFVVESSVEGLEDALSKKSDLGNTNAPTISLILQKLHTYKGEVVIILDDYDKMKLNFGHDDSAYSDISADEYFRSILSDGYYMIGTERIDCSKALFIITSNESKEALINGFGKGGAMGGGPSRLLPHVVEFGELDRECCERLVRKCVSVAMQDVKQSFRIRDIRLSKDVDNIKLMADYIYHNRIEHGRALPYLRTAIISACGQHGGVGEGSVFENQSIELTYNPGATPDKVGHFTARVLGREIEPGEDHRGLAVLAEDEDSRLAILADD